MESGFWTKLHAKKRMQFCPNNVINYVIMDVLLVLKMFNTISLVCKNKNTWIYL
jgi:hypothetical protein